MKRNIRGCLVAIICCLAIPLAGLAQEAGEVTEGDLKVDHGQVNWTARTITATGSGAPDLKAPNVAVARLGAERVAKMDYFVREVPQIDWQWMFVTGIFFGSLLGSTTSGSFRWKAVPDMWAGRFGPSRLKRAAAAFAGGLVAMFGARLADG